MSNQYHSHKYSVDWKQSSLTHCWLPEVQRLVEPIVAAWLLALCFPGSLIRRRKTEWAPLPVAFLDQRLDRIKWFPLLNWELLLPSVKLMLKPRLLFLAMFASGRNFRRFNGTWAIVHSLLYGTLPSFPQRAREREKKRELRDVSKVSSKQHCPVYVTPNPSSAFYTLCSFCMVEMDSDDFTLNSEIWD